MSVEHTDVAAYSLGLLGQKDREDFEAEEPDESAFADLVARRAAARRRQTRQRAWLAAAGIVLLASGVAAGVGLAPHKIPPAAVLQLTGQRHSATSLAGLHGVVGLVSRPWGTQVTLQLSKVRGPLDCQLIAVSAKGSRRVVVGWLVPAAGYGVPGHPAPLLIQGGTSIPRRDLSEIEIQVVGGPTLLTIRI